jgi:hypothetical protein
MIHVLILMALSQQYCWCTTRLSGQDSVSPYQLDLVIMSINGGRCFVEMCVKKRLVSLFNIQRFLYVVTNFHQVVYPH